MERRKVFTSMEKFITICYIRIKKIGCKNATYNGTIIDTARHIPNVIIFLALNCLNVGRVL
jgi:hypothetical protein